MFKIDAIQSVWNKRNEDYELMAPLRSNTTADVAIIGGGFTGVSTAYHLSRRFPSLRIVVLEARQLANGASGRNGGLMLNWINGVSHRDPHLTRLVYKTTQQGMDDIVATIDRHKLAVRYRRDGCLQVFTSARRAEQAHAYVEQLNAWGIPLQYLDRQRLAAHLAIQGGHGAILDPSEGQMHGVDLVRALRPVLVAQGVTIYEETPVLRIDEGRTIALVTPRGTVKAQAIVLATNGYTPSLGYFSSGIFPLHSHVLATEPLSAEMQAKIGWGNLSGFSDDCDRIAYGAMTPGGQLIFGGGSNAAYAYLYGGRTSYPNSPHGAHASFDAIQKHLCKYFPAAREVGIAHQWTGTLGITMSRICSMGVMGEYRNIYYALGYSGHGITLANLAGRVLCDLFAGDHEHWKDLPFYMRKLGGVPPEPLRWIGYHVYTRLTGQSPRKVE